MNIEELKRLAEAATPGPWFAAISSNMNNSVHVSMGTICDTGKNIDDAAYVAAANPAAILELIQQRDELLAALKDAAEKMRRCDYMQARSDMLTAIAKVEG